MTVRYLNGRTTLTQANGSANAGSRSARAFWNLCQAWWLGPILAIGALSCGNLENGGTSDASVGDACVASEQICSGECVDLDTSPEHCGDCDTQCASDELCRQGECDPICDSDSAFCNNECVTLASDSKNCGSCGHVCDEGKMCSAGECADTCAYQSCSGTGGDECVDLQTNPSHCGACETKCLPSHTCNSGECTLSCADSRVDCDDTCVDLTTDAKHCGACNQSCPEGVACVAGECDCGANLAACGDSCVDLTSDVSHCGHCDVACESGQVCDAGNCQCSAGSEQCEAGCFDLTTDAEHCGSCDHACHSGYDCESGRCVGPDGCFDLASDVTLTQVSVYQAVKVPIMDQLEPIAESARNADLVANRAAVFRVFVDLDPAFTSRELVARLRLTDGDTEQEFAARATLTGSSTDADAGSTFEINVPASAISESTRYSVEIAECTDHTGTPTAAQFPDTGDVALEARTTGPLKLHIIPVQIAGFVPDTSAAALKVYQDLIEAMYPISGVEISVASVMDGGDTFDWATLLETLRLRRAMDAPANDIYYYGLVRSTSTFKAYCTGLCVAGVGYVPAANAAGLRVATGVGYADQSSAIVMAHEVGHSNGRSHAPCGTTDTLDKSYPYAGAGIGVWGYDRRTSIFVPPTRKDIMSYCPPQWISDYTYQGILDRVATLNATVASFVTGAARAAPEASWRVLLGDAKGTRWSYPYTGEAPDAVRQSAIIYDQAGESVATVDVYQIELDAAGTAIFLVPEPRPGWYGVQIAGYAPLKF